MSVELLNYKQVAELMKSPVATVYGLVHQKRIPHIRLGNRFVRFEKEEIVKWLEALKVEVTGQGEVENE